MAQRGKNSHNRTEAAQFVQRSLKNTHEFLPPWGNPQNHAQNQLYTWRDFVNLLSFLSDVKHQFKKFGHKY